MRCFFFLLLAHHALVAKSTSSQSTKTVNTSVKVMTTMKPPVPKEIKLTPRNGQAFCRFGSPFLPTKSCQQQQECQTPMKLNAYCSDKEICCQEDPEGSESLCYDKRLPLFGEPKCSIESDCNDYGAVCKSGRCCPNFHYVIDEPLHPPTHFYVSNFSCVPGEPIPVGFQFAYCSNISETITYLGVVNKCGEIQHIHKHSKCQKDLDCYPGNICIQTIHGGMCFRNPEDCSKSTYYKMAVTFCYISFFTMILYFVTRACYEHPLRVSKTVTFLQLLPYDVTKKAEEEAFKIYGDENLTQLQNEMIVSTAAQRAWEENEKSMDRPALEHVLNWLGYVVQDSDYDSSSEKD